MRLTFLGTGTSFGVPQIGCGCAVCHSNDERDRRTRVGALVETDEGGRILVDTPPELRLQLVRAGVGHVDAVLYTHDHADHTHGIDDIRAFTARGGALEVYGSAATMSALQQKFRYIFDPSVMALPGTYKPEGIPRVLAEGETVRIAGADVTPVRVPHGRAEVFGYRIGALAYVTDAKAIPPAAVERLRGARVLVVNGLFFEPHPTHLSIPEAVQLARAVGAERTYLTHLTHRYSHAELESRLPPDVRPAYDGLTIDV
ncbi:beta-lactamase domain protein [Gemmatirosa kalamazoonensis]|uniref:Beta-lactamase domain protein n=1 Tax=Gemmatirosa kalamazoonensis TaxID=861299 RepID=W0RH15_9BACT|nr:MBL fold metallo-hydrolase [Gemmatirosa kalamazoonensis]AHG90409.1 beta-lactamase domain protein [Gemmatirosa kalamazoonensis]